MWPISSAVAVSFKQNMLLGLILIYVPFAAVQLDKGRIFKHFVFL